MATGSPLLSVSLVLAALHNCGQGQNALNKQQAECLTGVHSVVSKAFSLLDTFTAINGYISLIDERIMCISIKLPA